MTTPSTLGSTAVIALEGAWALLKEQEPTLPDGVFIVLGPRDREKVRGHFFRDAWKGPTPGTTAHEVAMSPSQFSDPSSTLETLVHEAVHALNHAAGIQDTRPPKNKYHNKKFKEKAEKLGLAVGAPTSYRGFAFTSWPEGKVPERYQGILDHLKANLPQGTTDKPPKVDPRKPVQPSSFRTIKCSCREISVSKKVAEAGDLICGLCREEFQVEEN